LNHLQKRYRPDPAIVSREIAGETILVPIRQSASDLESIYTLDEVGGRIWELLDGQRTVAEVRDAIVAEYDVSPQEAEADLLELLEQLEAIGVLQAVS